MNPTTFAAIRSRLDRLERRRPKPARPTFWDVLAGTAPSEQLPPEVLATLEAAGSRQVHDRIADRIEAALGLPCGLREVQPYLPATEPDPTVNRLGGKPCR
jgi:hypothetical protein